MLYQLRQQTKCYPYKVNDFMSQAEFKSKVQLDIWIKQTKENHALSNNMQWLLCDENSEYFMLAVA